MADKKTSREVHGRQQLAQHEWRVKLKNAEAKAQLLATIIEKSNDAITVQDLAGNILEWNRGAEKMYGWPEASALGMNINQIVPHDWSAEAKRIIRAVVAGEEVKSFETKRLTADGRIIDVWLTVIALVNDAGVPFAVATTERDITAKKQAEREKTDLIKDLQRALSEVKTLQGIIPICMFCKQIRNDQGYWEQVETYVHRHSGADFSHGICPNCMKTRYPRIYHKHEQKLLGQPKKDT